MESFKIQKKLESGYFKDADGLQIFYQSCRPDSSIKAVVIIVHGYAEHSSRYHHVMEYFINNNMAVETFDLRGHGKSEGARTFINSFENYVAELNMFYEIVQKKYPSLPIFLLGHSMGAAISTMFAIEGLKNPTGVILSGVPAKISDDISPLLVKMSGFIGAIFPKLPTIILDANAISRDDEVRNKYDNDPMVYRGKMPARTGAEITRTTKNIQMGMKNIKLPILIMHGSKDRLSDPEGSRILFDGVSSKDKTLKIYEGLFHEILNEPEKELVMQEISEWIEKHI